MNKKLVSILIVLAALFIAAPAFAQTTGNLNLSGSVAAVLSIAVAPEGVASSLDLTTGDVTDLRVAVVTERSNRSGGYTVTVESLNGGILDGAVTSDFLAYTLSYDGVAVGALAPATPVTITDTTGKTTGTGTPKDLDISYTLGALLYEDTYADTLTFEIAPK